MKKEYKPGDLSPRLFVLAFAALVLSVNTGAAQQVGTVTVEAPMPKGGAFWTAATVDSIVYVAGAASCTPTGLRLCGFLEAYNPATNTWAFRAPMTYPRLREASGVINGIYYAAGGDTGVGPVNTWRTLEAYDPKSDSWTTRTPMPTARTLAGAAVVGSKLYVLGGYRGFGVTEPDSNTVEAYDPATDTWSTKAPMLIPQSRSAVAVVDGIVYVIGGSTNSDSVPWADGPTATTESYDPNTNTWTARAPVPFGLEAYELHAGVVNGMIFVFNFRGSVGEYNPKSDVWTEVEAPLMLRSGVSVGSIGDQVYVVGGLGNGGSPVLAVNEAFSPFLPVTIRVNPASINLKSNAKIKVAILSTSMFDATSINPDTVKLSGALAETEQNGTPIFSFADVNDDGILDLVISFRARDLQPSTADKQVVLKGQTFAGQLVKGVATVRFLPPVPPRR